MDISEALEEQKDSKIMLWVKTLGEMHEKYKTCLAEGRYRELLLTNRQLAFMRFTEEEGLITAVNNDEEPAQVSIPVPMENKHYVNLLTQEEAEPENGRLNFTIEAAGSVLLEIRNSTED